MNNTEKKFVGKAMSTLLILLVTLSFISCKSHSSKRSHNTDHAINYVKKKLDLSVEQITTINPILRMLEHEKEKAKLLQTDLENEIIKAFTSKSFNEEKINSLFEAALNELSESKSILIDNLSKIHKTLSAEQRRKLNELLADHHSKRHNHER